AFTVTTEADGISRSYVNRQGQNLSPTADNLLLCPAGETPTATLSKGQVTLTIPGREHWQAGAMLSGRLRLDDLPPVLPHAQPLPLSLRLEWQDMPPEQVLQHLTVTVTQVNAGGADLDTAQTAVTITSAGAIPLLTLPLADACRQVIITCGLPGHHVLTPLTLTVLRPTDNLHGLNAKGNNLFQHGHRAVLVCHPLPKTPLANAPTPSFRTSNPLRIAVLDDFMATTTAHDAELLPETVMTAVLQQDGFSPQITRVPAANLPGTSSRLAPWKALAAAHDLRPDVIVLAVGTLPLADAIEPREWSSHLLFAVQSSLAAGIAPALVALPALPAVDPARGRLAALYTKEIGLAMGLPVFDLYSRRKVDAGRLSRWFQPGRPAATSPDDDARHWLATATAQAFLRHYHPDQVNP
ncbi:MAG: hypothetical protein PHC30_10180, partial [Lentisphaeria bacterium]|nr:hypothetical protein [Lentisphaeria bacterium]